MLVTSRPTRLKDTAEPTQGFAGRIVAHDKKAFLVTRSDLDSFLRILRWDETGTAEFSQDGQGNPLDAGVSQGMVAAYLQKGSPNLLHIVAVNLISGMKKVAHWLFDVDSETWAGTTTLTLADANTTLDGDAVSLHVDDDTLHLAVWFKNASDKYDLAYASFTNGVWSAVETIATDQDSTPAYVPCINSSSGRVLVLGDSGAGDLTTQFQWTAYERQANGSWESTAIKGLGQATLVNTRGGVRHILFQGDKRHTIIKGTTAQLKTELGAIQFEQPDVDGGIIQGVNYAYGFGAAVNKNDIYVTAAANGKLYQGGYINGKWRVLRAVTNLTATRRTKIAVTMAPTTADGIFAAAKFVNCGNNGWHLFELDESAPIRAGVTHDLVINGKGFMSTSLQALQKADISQAVPRVSIATEQKTEDELSDLSSIAQSTWHHGRGDRTFSNPNAYFDADGLLLHIPDQVTPQYLSYATAEQSAGLESSSIVGPGGGLVGPGGGLVGPLQVTPAQFNGHPADSVLYQGNFYVLIHGDAAANNKLILWNNVDSHWQDVSAGIDTTSGVPQDLEIFNEDLWVAQGDAVNARFFDFSAATWKDGQVPAYCFKEWDGRLWRADDINEIFYSSDPDAATPTWTSLGTVDDGSGTTRRIKRMEVLGGILHIFADMGVWTVTGDATNGYLLRPLLDDSAQRSPVNGQAAANFQGVLYYNVGDGVTRYDGATRIEVGPNRSPIASSKYQALPPEKQGDFASMVATDNLLYMAIDAGPNGRSTVYVYSGTGWNEFWQADEIGQRCRWVFHTPPLTSGGVLSNRLLWVEQGGSIYYIILPRNGENPLTDPNMKYKMGGQYKLITGWQHYNLPALYKVLHDLIGRFENFGSGEDEPNLHVYFQTEEGPDSFDINDWTYLATFSQDLEQNLDILQRIKWVSNPGQFTGAVGGLAFKNIRYMLVFDCEVGGATSTTTPPILRTFGQRFTIRTDRRFGFTSVIQAYDDSQLLDGSSDPRSGSDILHELYGFADQVTPHFVEDGDLVPIVNWVLNPGFELDSNGDGLADAWSELQPASVVTSQSPKHKTHGRFSQKVVVSPVQAHAGISQNEIYIPPGVSAHLETFVFVESGLGAQVRIVNADTQDVIDRASVVYPAIATRPPVSFSDSHAHVDAQETLTQVEIQVVVPQDLADGATTTTFYTDSSFFYLGSDEVPHHYVDGDQPRCQWDDDIAEPYLSPSYRLGGYFVNITGINKVPRTQVETQDGRVVKGSDVTLFMREV